MVLSFPENRGVLVDTKDNIVYDYGTFQKGEKTMLRALFKWKKASGTEDTIVFKPKSIIADFARHPETGRWSIQVAYYDSMGELMGFNFFPVSTVGLNAWFSHDEGKLGLHYDLIEKGIQLGIISTLEKRGLLASIVAAL